MSRILRRSMALALALLLISACDRQSATVVTGNTMGTTYTVKVIDRNADAAELKNRVDAELVRINSLMSTYQTDSELSRFNRAPVGEWFPVSADLLEVLKLSARLYDLSGGSFDVTVGPIVNLWGFGPDPATMTIPSEEQIAAALARVGFTHLKLGDGAIMKDTETYVDLSAIAKGYGVDAVARVIEMEGFTNYLVEVGGELRAKGLNDRGEPWRIAIERPDVDARVPFTAINISEVGLATSGDYRNYFEKDGVRYSHTMDPATGRPIKHSLASVTVVAETTAIADGLATAIDVMGPERGFEMAIGQNLAVFAIIHGADGFIERHTPAFEAYLHD